MGGEEDNESDEDVVIDEKQQAIDGWMNQAYTRIAARLAESRLLTIFLSSPFNGLRIERDVFINRFLPLLRGRAQNNGIHVTTGLTHHRIRDSRRGLAQSRVAVELVELSDRNSRAFGEAALQMECSRGNAGPSSCSSSRSHWKHTPTSSLTTRKEPPMLE